RIAEVHLRVDRAGQHEAAARVELGAAGRGVDPAPDLLDPPTEDQHVALDGLLVADDLAAPDDEIAAAHDTASASRRGRCRSTLRRRSPTPPRIITSDSVWPIVMPSSTVPSPPPSKNWSSGFRTRSSVKRTTP